MFSSIPRYSSILVAIASMVTAGSSSAITIASGTSDENYRFDTNRGGATFVADGFDLSGVGVTSSNRRWATLLSRNVVISASHNRPDFVSGGFNNSVTFYSSNDPAGASHTSTISNAFRIPGSDIFLGVLDDPVPSTGYISYEFITEDINSTTDYNNSSLRYEEPSPGPFSDPNEVNAYTFGNQGTGGGSTNQWVGRNIIDGWREDVEANYSFGQVIDDALTLDYNTVDAGSAPPVQYESVLQSGDSGAPLFIESNGEILLTGVAWFTYNSLLGDPEGTGYMYLGNYDTEIQTYIDANPIPEPDVIALLFGAGFVLLLRRKRK